MIKVIMHGCNGRMGQIITELMKDDKESCIVAGIDITDTKDNGYPVFTNINDCQIEADVIIDFASTQAIDSLLDYSISRQIPVVLCTTGLSDEHLDKIQQVSKKIAILRSANMSLGINMLMSILQAATKVLVPAGFDIEIVEKHHKHKVDAPSGTALALAEAINEVLDNSYQYNYDRSTERKAREKKEIGIQAVRGGTIVGEHEVIFAGVDELIEIKHTAYSRAIFGKGAIQAGKFLSSKKVGLYNMSHVING